MKRYNDYKDSGIEWLGNIPKHWETFRFIDNVKLRHGYQFRDYDFTDEGIRVVKISQLDPKGNLNLTKSSFIASNRLKSFKSIRIYQDDILMALTGGTIGKIIRVGKISEPLLQNYRVGNFFPDKKKLNKTFLYFLLASQFTEEQINYLLNRNGQPNIGKESFKNMFFTLPPLKEQTQLANYLDAKTTSIDKKIKLLKQKIKHYKAYSKSLINETVTKGLDKTVKLKDSGIDWIGEIPDHWEVKRNKDLFTERGEKAYTKIYDLLSVSEYYGVARREEKIKEDQVLVRAESLDDYKVCKIDDLVINIMLAWKKGLGVSKYDGLVSPAYGVFKRKLELFPVYYHYLFRTDLYTAEFKRNSRGIIESRLRLYPDKFFSISSIFPPLKEQQQIADFLDAKTTTIDNIVNNLEIQITTLKELRKTLINEVVTGKVKVTT